MTPDALDSLGEKELIAIILAQAGMIEAMQARIKELEAQLARVAELEAELAKLKKPPQDTGQFLETAIVGPEGRPGRTQEEQAQGAQGNHPQAGRKPRLHP